MAEEVLSEREQQIEDMAMEEYKAMEAEMVEAGLPESGQKMEDVIDDLEVNSNVTLENDEPIEGEVDDLGEEGSETTDDDDSVDNTATPDNDDPQLYDVVIDGVESKVSIEDLTTNYQKRGHADNMMEEAATAQDQLKLDQAEWLVKKEQESLQEPVENANISEMTIGRADELAVALDDLSVGSEQERIEAAKSILSMVSQGRGDNQAVTLDQQEIVSQATEQATRQMQFQNAQVKFADDYKDLTSDPTLTAMADTIMREEAATSATYEEAFTKAGDKVRKWKDDLIGKQLSQKPNRKAIKADLPNEPVSRGKPAAAEPVDAEPSDSEIILQMRKDRGQEV